MTFESLSLAAPLRRSLQAAGYSHPTPIQSQAIPPLMLGRDMVGCAQTGTGKTAAFLLPTLHRLLTRSAEPRPTKSAPKRREIRCLILAPTRELAAQIGANLAVYGKGTGLRHAVIYGGVGQAPQVRALQSGIDILVATPGRLLDLQDQRFLRLGSVEILILDEADQMLDMGFIQDLRRIVALVPRRRQTMMFSATMPTEIRRLADQWLDRPSEVHVAPIASTPRRIAQSVYYLSQKDKAETLTRFFTGASRGKTLVFSRTKRGADKIAKFLQQRGVRALSVHGGKSQSKRTAIIQQFSSPHPPVLIATDLAARGLDFTGITYVINYDLPDTPEAYVHRIGRTARMGAEGRAISFCLPEDRHLLRTIERKTGSRITVEGELSQELRPESSINARQLGRRIAAKRPQWLTRPIA
jgi:ATP-dependent RNA helicase RhlE